MIIDRLLMLCGTLALAGSTLTALRLPGLPVGVPELLGFAFIGGTLLRRPRLSPSFLMILLCSGLLLVGMMIGSVNNGWIGAPTQTLNLELAATGYAVLLALLYSNALIAHPNRILWFGRGLALALCIHAVPLTADLLGVEFPIGGWIGEEELATRIDAEERLSRIQSTEALTDKSNRYQGLSTNPNQLSLAAAVAVVLFPWIGATVRRAWAPGWWLLTVGSMAMLLLTKSSSAMIGVAVACLLMLVRYLAASRNERGMVRYSPITLAVTWGLLVPALLVLRGFLDRAINGENNGEMGDGQASGRFPLWRGAWKGIQESYFLGVGPGPQAGFEFPFRGEEAHNVWLDLGLQGGLLSVAAFGVLLLFVLRRTVSGRSAIGIALLTLFVVIGLSHYLLRHPLYWALICLPAAINQYFSLPAQRWRADARARHQLAREQRRADHEQRQRIRATVMARLAAYRAARGEARSDKTTEFHPSEARSDTTTELH